MCVFARQGTAFAGVSLASTLIALALGVSSCRKPSPGRATTAPSSSSAQAAQALPERPQPALPPRLPAPEAVPTPAPERRGGALRVHLDAEPSHLNPVSDPDAVTMAVVSGLVYEPLLECPSPGVEGGGYRPLLAESWELSPDGLRLSLRVRPGVRWQDDRAFGVMDVHATLEPLLLAPGVGGTKLIPPSPVLRAALADVAGIELGAERTVRLLLKRPSDLVLRALCEIPILPDHLLRGAGADPSALARQPVGTGPFRVAAWERGRRIRLVRWPAYRAGGVAGAGAAGGAAALEEISFEIDVDGARALARARRGEIDILPRVLEAHYPDEVDPVTLHGAASLFRLTPERWAYVAVNHRRAPLGDVRFRTALSALWDRARAANDLYKGLARPLLAPPFGEPPGADVSSPMTSGPAGPSGGQGGRAAAAALLEAAGYRDTDADGVRDQAGRAIRLSLLQATGSRAAATAARAFVLEARRAGLLVDIVPVDAATLLARARKGDFDLAPLVWEGLPDEDPAPLFGSGGAFNFGGYRSAEVDAALDTLRRAGGPAARRPLYAALAARLERELPVLPLYRFDVAALVGHRVHGLAAVGGALDLRRVWVDP